MIYIISCTVSILISLGVTWNKRISQSDTRTKNGIVLIDKNRRNATYLMILSGLMPALVSALRYGVGTDYLHNYLPWFYMIQRGEETSAETGYVWLNRLVGFFTNDAQWVFVVTSFLFVYFVYYSIYKASDNIQLSILLLYISYTYLISLNNIRQSLASAIALIGLINLSKGRNIRAIIFIAVSSLFHVSMLPLLIIVLLYRIRIKASVLLGINLFFFILKNTIVQITLKVLPLISFKKFQNYYKLDSLEIYLQKSIGISTIVLNFFLMFLIALVEERDNIKTDELKKNELSICKYLQFFALLICTIDGVIPATYRWLRIFTFPQFLFVPNLITNFENRKDKIIIAACVLAMYIVVCVGFVQSGMEAVIPYVSIFSRG